MQPSSNLSVEEAYKILGLKKGCSKEDVITATNGLQKKISAKDLDSNTQQLATLVDSAIALDKSLSILLDLAEKPQAK